VDNERGETLILILSHLIPISILFVCFFLGKGLEFRDPTLVLNAKNLALFKNDMFFNLTIGFQNVPLTDKVI